MLRTAQADVVVSMCFPRLRNCLALFFLAVLIASSVSAQNFPIPPTPSTLVNDYAGLLSTGERDALERKLVAYNDSTSTQIAVVILRTLNGADPGMTATEIGRAWGVGQAGVDNGVVLLVSVDDRKLFIATGYGTEAVLTDAVAGRIIRNVIAPRFRQGRYYAGIDEATDAIAAAAAGEFSIADRAPGGANGSDIVLVFFVLLVLLIVVFIIAANSKGGGGTFGGGPGWIVMPGGRGGWSGGSSFGGGFGGGGFSGGFGGFGGGGFGGGGAGGGW